MRKGTLTREDAIKEAGLKAVEAVENENCDFTGRLQTDGDDSAEFAASVQYTDADDMPCTLIAYYYQMQEDIERVEELDMLDWEVEGYEVY